MPRRTTDDGLSPREELFVHAYIASGNATDAARQAGYSTRSANQRATEVLSRPHVQKAIEAARTRIVRKFNVTAERIVEEMAVIGFSDIRHYAIDENGYLELADGAPDSAMRAVKRVKRKLRRIPQEDGEPIVEIDTEFELWSKDSQVRNLGDYRKLFKENRADDDDEDNTLSPEQLKERVFQLLRVAAKRARSGKKAG